MGEKRRRWRPSRRGRLALGLTALAVALLGYYTSSILRQSELRQTNERVYTELMSSREQAESGLRKDMFLSIIQTFLRPEAAGLEARMLNLEMLAYNFHESLNLKPLFSHMDRLITASTDPGKTGYVNRLNQVAREITTRQLVLLEQVGKKFGRTVDFDKFQKATELFNNYDLIAGDVNGAIARIKMAQMLLKAWMDETDPVAKATKKKAFDASTTAGNSTSAASASICPTSPPKAISKPRSRRLPIRA